MSKKMYMAHLYYDDIRAVEVSRKTENFVYMLCQSFGETYERKTAKETDNQKVCNSFEEARDWLVGKRIEKVKEIKDSLEKAEFALGQAVAMKPKEN